MLKEQDYALNKFESVKIIIWHLYFSKLVIEQTVLAGISMNWVLYVFREQHHGQQLNPSMRFFIIQNTIDLNTLLCFISYCSLGGGGLLWERTLKKRSTHWQNAIVECSKWQVYFLHKMYKITSKWTARSPPPSSLPCLNRTADMKSKIWNKCLRQVRWSKPKRMVFSETTHTQFRFTEQLKMNKNTIFTVSSELLQHAIYIFIRSLCFSTELRIEMY